MILLFTRKEKKKSLKTQNVNATFSGIQTGTKTPLTRLELRMVFFFFFSFYCIKLNFRIDKNKINKRCVPSWYLVDLPIKTRLTRLTNESLLIM